MTLSVRIVSDLHCEFDGTYRLPIMGDEKEQILVISGDLGLGSKSYTYLPFIEDAADRFREVIYICGNHEFYKGKFPYDHNKIHSELIPYENVSLLEKETVIFDGVAFIGATLWTDMNNHDPNCMMQAEMCMNDYRIIRTGSAAEPWKRKLRPRDTIEDHIRARQYIFEEIKKQKAKGNKVVVASHHAPSYLSVADKFKGDPVNGAYASELFEHIMDLGDDQPDMWVHGHTHVSFDYMIGETRVVCNPRGYSTMDSRDLNPNFDPCLTFGV